MTSQTSIELAKPRRGRLAPSPTGELHLGNLSSLALAWIQARSCGADLVLRIEDLDPPRCIEGAEERIVEDLRWLGVEWDQGPAKGGTAGPFRQSARQELYQRELAGLRERGLVYPCFCSRRDIRDVLSAPHGGFDPATQYPGTCSSSANWDRATVEPHAVRFRASGTVTLDDGVFGRLSHDLDWVPGDFVIRRRDGLYAYQFAVVVDDIAMGVTEIVRGHDLLDSTPRQFGLFDAMRADRPQTWHVPLLMSQNGERLSKRARSVARPGLEAVGWTPSSLRGLLAWLWGWIAEPEPLEERALIDLWAPQTLGSRLLHVPDAVFEGPKALRKLAREEAARELRVKGDP